MLTLAAAPAVGAQSYAYDNSSPVNVTEVVPYMTSFDMLGGMEVSWTLTGGAGSAVWSNLGGGLWGIWTDDFKLYGPAGGDTWSTRWSLWAMNLVSFSVSALPGNAVFDVISHPDLSPGSESGKIFSGWSGYYNANDIFVTYANPVGVAGAAPLGDLYGTMTVEFKGGSWEYGCSEGSLTYKNGYKTCESWSYDYKDKVATLYCPWSGYTLYGNICKKGSSHKTPAIKYDCPSGYQPYNNTCKKKVYEYTEPSRTWVPEYFGTSDRCDGSKSPTYYKNDKCLGKFYQDMDNVIPEPDTPQETVPEPATMTLLATGLVGMAASQRRRKR